MTPEPSVGPSASGACSLSGRDVSPSLCRQTAGHIGHQQIPVPVSRHIPRRFRLVRPFPAIEDMPFIIDIILPNDASGGSIFVERTPASKGGFASPPLCAEPPVITSLTELYITTSICVTTIMNWPPPRRPRCWHKRAGTAEFDREEVAK